MKRTTKNDDRRKRREGGLRWSNSEQRYIAEHTIGYSPKGKRIRKVVTGPRGDDSKDAERGVEERLRQLVLAYPTPKRGQRRIVQTITLGEYAEEWIDERDPSVPTENKIHRYARTDSLSAAAHGAYTWAIDGHIAPSKLASKQLDAISNEDLCGFLDGLKLGNAGKAKCRVVLQAIFKDAMSVAKIRSDNPATDLPTFNGAARETPCWDKAEALKFLTYAKRSEHFSMFLTMIVGALGPGECFGLRYRNLNCERGTITVEGNLTEVAGRLVEGATKTKFRRRTFVLPKFVARELCAREAKARKRPGFSKDNLIFTSPQGGGIRRTTFSARVWLPLLKKAKVPAIPLYGIRHSSASLLAALGVPLLVASRQLGHGSIGTTANVYSHLFADASQEVADKFDTFFKDL
jgi:integrase